MQFKAKYLLIQKYYIYLESEHLKVGWLPNPYMGGGDNMNKKDFLIFSLVIIIFFLLLLLFIVLI